MIIIGHWTFERLSKVQNIRFTGCKTFVEFILHDLIQNLRSMLYKFLPTSRYKVLKKAALFKKERTTNVGLQFD